MPEHSHTHGARAITRLALLATLIAAPAGAVVVRGQYFPTNQRIILTDCFNDISNNLADGDLHVTMRGQTLHCQVQITVNNNWVRGDLVLEVETNTIIGGGLQVDVQSNQQIGGKLRVKVESNDIHRNQAPTIDPYDLQVTVNANGGNIGDITLNRVVAGGIEVRVDSNFVKDQLRHHVTSNFTAADLDVDVDYNIVNTMESFVEGNRACRDTDVQYRSNTIDRIFIANVRDNRATRDFTAELVKNEAKFVPDRIIDATLSDNHAATGDLVLSFDENRADERLEIEMRDNGAGGDGTLHVMANERTATFDVDIGDNRLQKTVDITVQNNKTPPNPYVIENNFACGAAPALSLQPTPTRRVNNVLRCMQTLGAPDGDGDGLTDDFERMIGTDFRAPDTDRDGLWDGWRDGGSDKVWTAGEAVGELGDPRSPVGGTHVGAVDSLFRRSSEAPNCFCRDIYVELDGMRAPRGNRGPGNRPDGPHRLRGTASTRVTVMFLKRGIFLHVDEGWPLGGAPNDAPGGGERIGHRAPLRFLDANGFDLYNVKNGETTADWDGDGRREPRHFSSLRKGSFRYGLVVHNVAEFPTRAGLADPHPTPGDPGGDDFMIAEQVVNNGVLTPAVTVVGMAYILCHELGHTLGLGLTPATHESAPASYQSCMSFHSSQLYNTIGYSDGRSGTVDDWRLMNLEFGLNNPSGGNRDPTK